MGKTASKPFDATCKDLVELRPRDLLALAHVSEVIDAQLVDADLATIVAAADKVLRVQTTTGEFLVHFEFQSGRDLGLADRIFWYNAALCHRHGLPVQTVVVLLAPPADIADLTGDIETSIERMNEFTSWAELMALPPSTVRKRRKGKS